MKIEISNLKKTFGENTAVDINDFTIQSGEMLGLVGNNGAGKTTLFRLILDLLKADDGRVLLTPRQDDTNTEQTAPSPIDPSRDEAWKSLTGAYIDEGFLIDFLTPEEYFHFIGKVSGLSQDAVDEHINQFEHFMGGEVIGQKKLIRNLSAGNKQKVGIISTFLSRPKLVILDEPFNFLDPTSQNILKHKLTEYNKETGATILVSSHNLAHTVDICPRIALLEHGVVIRDLANDAGSAKEELENYFDS